MLTTVLIKKLLTNFYVQTQEHLGFIAHKKYTSFGGTFSPKNKYELREYMHLSRRRTVMEA